MNDIEYELNKENREKKSIGRNLKHMNRSGKGPIRFPSDYLSNKEKKKLNGPVISYDLKKPMTYADFRKMPEDLQKKYLEGVIERFKPTIKHLSELFGIGESTMYNRMKMLDVKLAGPKGSRNKEFNEIDWDAWIADEKVPINVVSENEETDISEKLMVPEIHVDSSFKTIAFIWSSYLADHPIPLKPEDVAAMFAILKMVDISSGKATKKDWEELSRYALFASKIV